MEYKGIKLSKLVKLHNSDGSVNQTVVRGLDAFAAALERKDHTLESQYLTVNDNL